MLVQSEVREFTAKLASGEPVPGGGSASALTAALGTALASMVVNLSVAKAQGEDEVLLEEILQESEGLQNELLQLVDADAAAFGAVARVFKMPRDTQEEKAARREAMEKALQGAARVPLEIARLSKQALVLHKRLLELGNPNVLSDIGVGALLLGAGLRGAYLNVQINLQGIKERSVADQLEKEVVPLLREGEKLAEMVYQEVEGRLNQGREK